MDVRPRWHQLEPAGSSKITVNTVAGNEQGQGDFGSAVGLSGDGIRALVGAPNDNQAFGAVWAFNQVPSCSDQVASVPPGGGTVSVALSCLGPEGQPITYAIATGPSHGGVGSINQATGAITYVSQPGFIGTTRSPTWPATPAGPRTGDRDDHRPARPAHVRHHVREKRGGRRRRLVKLSCTAPAGVGIQYGSSPRPPTARSAR